ncbi:MAG TPA: hypothetical protein PK718_08725 [Candidatus Methanofastidiosa archaeon]|nr:hypothetical protein [Candidatus Methanofastidiosa archaeon]
MSKLEELFTGRICDRVESIFEGIEDGSKAQGSLDVLKEIESILQEFKRETEGLDIDKALNIQLATQFKNAAAQFLHLEDYFNSVKAGDAPSIDKETARKYASNLNLVLNGFADYAKEIDRGHERQPYDLPDDE